MASPIDGSVPPPVLSKEDKKKRRAYSIALLSSTGYSPPSKTKCDPVGNNGLVRGRAGRVCSLAIRGSGFRIRGSGFGVWSSRREGTTASRRPPPESRFATLAPSQPTNPPQPPARAPPAPRTRAQGAPFAGAREKKRVAAVRVRVRVRDAIRTRTRAAPFRRTYTRPGLASARHRVARAGPRGGRQRRRRIEQRR